jgi:DNA-binding response OmpR family regulator
MLESAGYAVQTAADGEAGLAKALEIHPALIIIDYQMPQLDGVETIKRLRDDAWGAKVPIIFATNVYDVNVVNKILQLGVRDYLLKNDISLDSIRALVERYVPI